MTLAAIAARTALPPATVHRMLAQLVEWGGVEHLAHGRYRLGTRIWRLGIGAHQVSQLREIGHPHLVALHVATGGTVYMGVLDGHDALFTDRITRVRANEGSARPARRLPLYASGGGRVLLAYSQQVLGEIRASAPPEVALLLEGIGPQLDHIRRAGACIVLNDGWPGRSSVSAPIFAADGGIVASVTVAFPPSRIAQPESIVPTVIAAARGISLELA